MAGNTIKSGLPSFAGDAKTPASIANKSFADIINNPTPGVFAPGSPYTELTISNMYKQDKAMRAKEAAAARKAAKDKEPKKYIRLGGRQPPHDTRAAQVLAALGIDQDLMRAIVASAQLAPTVR